MTKTELIYAVAQRSGLQKKDAEKAVNAALDAITAALRDGDRVQLVGFGTFDTHTREACTRRNPANGDRVEVPAARVPGFKPGKQLKDAVK